MFTKSSYLFHFFSPRRTRNKTFRFPSSICNLLRTYTLVRRRSTLIFIYLSNHFPLSSVPFYHRSGDFCKLFTEEQTKRDRGAMEKKSNVRLTRLIRCSVGYNLILLRRVNSVFLLKLTNFWVSVEEPLLTNWVEKHFILTSRPLWGNIWTIKDDSWTADTTITYARYERLPYIIWTINVVESHLSTIECNYFKFHKIY